MDTAPACFFVFSRRIMESALHKVWKSCYNGNCCAQSRAHSEVVPWHFIRVRRMGESREWKRRST